MDEEKTGLDGLFEQLQGNEPAGLDPEVVSEAEVPSEADTAAVAEGVDTAKPPEEPEAPPTHPTDAQPRDEKGRFAPKAEAEAETGDEPATEELVDDGLEWEEVAITLPTGEKVPVEVAPELADYINDLSEQAGKTAEIEQEVTAARELAQEAQSRQAELDEIEGFIATDPAGYLSERVRPDLRQEVVLDLLLTDDAIYEAVAEQLDKWLEAPHERRVMSAERRASRVEKRVEFEQTRAQREQHERQASVLLEAMNNIVPTDMDPEQARRFHQDMYRDLTEYGRRNGWQGVTPDKVPEILAFRIGQYGVNPNTVTGARRSDDGLVVAAPANDTAKAIADAQAKSEKLQKQYQRRRAAGASAPAGAGTPANRARPPKGANLQEALDWARKSIGGA